MIALAVKQVVQMEVTHPTWGAGRAMIDSDFHESSRARRAKPTDLPDKAEGPARHDASECCALTVDDASEWMTLTKRRGTQPPSTRRAGLHPHLLQLLAATWGLDGESAQHDKQAPSV